MQSGEDSGRCDRRRRILRCSLVDLELRLVGLIARLNGIYTIEHGDVHQCHIAIRGALKLYAVTIGTAF